jgi:hypothetical protein
MAAFDAADPNLIVGRRDATTSPSQGLYVLNSPFVIEQAEQIARRILDSPTRSDSARIERMFLTILARRPTPQERHTVASYLTRPTSDLAGEPSTDCDVEQLSAWTSVAQAMMALPEFRFVF